MSIKFFDPDSDSALIDNKTDIDIENDIPLCDTCQNIILVKYKEHPKLICPNCHMIYNPKYEYIQIQDQETTLDEISGRGEISYHDDAIPTQKTLNRSTNNHENLDYINREFEKVRQIELVDKEVRRPYKRLQR